MINFLKNIFKKKSGFTTAEFVVTVAIVSVLVAFAVSSMTTFKNNQNFKQDSQVVLESIQFAQSKAQLGEGGSSWGVLLTSEANGGYLEVFSGDTYSSSNVVKTQRLSGASRFLNPSAGTTKTIIFSSITGLPSVAHMVSIQKYPYDGTAYIISISRLGKLSSARENGLLGMWGFNEGAGSVAYDASGNGSNGLIYGTPDWGTTGAEGGYLNLDGSTNYISVTSTVALDLTSVGSVMAWIVMPSSWSGSNYPDVVSKGANAGWDTNGWSLFAFNPSDNRIGVGIRNGSNSQNVSFTNTIKNQWVHIAGTWDGSVVRVYQNGVEKASSTQTVVPPTTATNVAIGRDGGSQYYDGQIDDVRIYYRALTGDEIKEIYERY